MPAASSDARGRRRLALERVPRGLNDRVGRFIEAPSGRGSGRHAGEGKNATCTSKGRQNAKSSFDSLIYVECTLDGGTKPIAGIGGGEPVSQV